MKELLNALSEVKKELGKMQKNTTNPFYNSKYFDINQLLEHTEPLLQKQGLIILQPIKENRVYSEIYHIESCEKMQSYIELPNITDPQKLGSAITYFRRYTLGSLLGVQAEDDDGNRASGQKSKEQSSNNPSPEKWLNVMNGKDFTPEWVNIQKGVLDGKIKSVDDVRKFYKVSKEVAVKITELLNNKS